MWTFYISHLVPAIFFFSLWFFFWEVIKHYCKWVSVLLHKMFNILFETAWYWTTGSSDNILHLSVWMVVIWFAASGLVFVNLKNSLQWGKCSKCPGEAENHHWSDSVWCSYQKSLEYITLANLSFIYKFAIVN